MRDNASSKVKQGINKLMKLKMKKSSKKVVNDYYHPSEEKKTNKFIPEDTDKDDIEYIDL